MNDGELVAAKFQGPTGLSTRKFLLGGKINEVAVIGPDFKGEESAFKVLAEMVEGFDNGKEFFIVDGITSFGKGHSL